MSMSRTLPSVLQDPRGSISMERALKQIHELLVGLLPSQGEPCGEDYDKVFASIDDVETMLAHIQR